jgi:ABC-2 type transport system ATP-binding protein
MINRSRKVLDGRLRELRRSFSLNAVAVRFEDLDSFPNDPEVASVREVGEEFEVLLNPGANPQALLKRLVDSGVVISKFELVEPSLHDIFIQKVREAA